MKNSVAVMVSLGCLVLGAGIALAAKSEGPGMELIRGKPAHEAGPGPS